MNKNGNALFLILIAVALFAALSYAVTQTGRGGGNIDKEETTLLAQELIDFTNTLNATVNRMILSGAATADTIVFETSSGSGNPCTTGTTCVFAPEGGNVNFYDIPYPVFQNKWFFPVAGDGFVIQDVGSNSLDEVAASILQLPKDLCAEINRQLGLPAPDDLAFNGNFSYNNIYGSGVVMDSIAGETVGCFRDEAAYPQDFGFYHVFVAR